MFLPSYVSVGKIEEQIAGDAEERAVMMPLCYISTSREKAEIDVWIYYLTHLFNRAKSE